MGLNIDNLFVQSDDAGRLVAAIGTAANGAKKKFSYSNVGRGWMQVIDAHGISPPDFAAKLSLELGARVVCAQVYEVSGDAALHVFNHGDLLAGWKDDDAEDPSAKVQFALRAEGIDVPLLMFRDTVHRSGWTLEEKK